MNLNVGLFTVTNWLILLRVSTSHILSNVTTTKETCQFRQEVGLHKYKMMMPVRFSSLIMTDTQSSLYMVVNTVNGSQSLVRVVTHVTTHAQVYPQSYISAGHPIIIYLDACKHHKSQNWQAMEKKLVQVKVYL